jgi:hypothetical protein
MYCPGQAGDMHENKALNSTHGFRETGYSFCKEAALVV